MIQSQMAELPKTYDPRSVEPKWYARWIDNRDFKADAHSAKPAFSIVMPPPNITGVLTLGHVLNNTIQDVLARRARMQALKCSGCREWIMPASGRKPLSKNGYVKTKA